MMKAVALRGLGLLLAAFFSAVPVWGKALDDASFQVGLIKQAPESSGPVALTLHFSAQQIYVPIAGEIDVPIYAPTEWTSYSLTKKASNLPLVAGDLLRARTGLTQYDFLSPGVATTQSPFCDDVNSVDIDNSSNVYAQWCFENLWDSASSVSNTLIDYVPYVTGDITGDGYNEVFVPALGVFITNFFGEINSSLPPYVHSQYDDIQGIAIPTFDTNGNRLNYNTYNLTDLNGDGRKDLLILRPNGAPFVAYNDWNGVFSRVQIATGYLNGGNANFSTTLSAVAGETSVEGGIASYTAPIGVPVGTAEVAPKLGISYSSGGGGGPLGMGWSLAGADSAITRCGLGYIDRVSNTSSASGVTYSNVDVLCLDGQQLSLVSGNYWASGAVYSPRQDSVTKVVQWGTEGGGSFIVFDKSGDIRSYGLNVYEGITTNSKLCLSASGGRAACTDGALLLIAGLSAVQDKVGNYMVMIYDLEQYNNNLLALKTIRYTGNAAQNLAPYNRVEINYENRSDVSTSYAFGAKVVQNKRITSIASYGESDVLYREYRFFHINDNLTGATQMIGLTECVANSVCAKPTVFEWSSSITREQLKTETWEAVWAWFTNSGMSEEFDYTTIQYPDVNGDGRVDICGRHDDGIYCILSGAGGFWGGKGVIRTTICKNGGNGSDNECNAREYYTSIRFIDMDGDGLDDLVWRGRQGVGVSYTIKGGSGGAILGTANALAGLPSIGAAANATFSFADTNGDALPRLCTHSPSEGIYCYTRAIPPSTASGAPFVYNTTWSRSSFTGCRSGNTTNGTCNDDNNFKTIAYMDFDGDGKSDLVYRSDAGMRVWRSTRTLYLSSSLCADYTDCSDAISYRYPDLNGDGLPEFCYLVNGGDRMRCHINTGKEWKTTASTLYTGTTTVAGAFFTNRDSGITFGDMNDDGLDDLLVANNGGFKIYINAGQGADDSFSFEDVKTINDPQLNSIDNWQTVSIVDNNGDGVKDVVSRHDNGVYTLHFSTRELPHYLKSIENGFGLRTDIHYSNLFDSDVYTPSTGEIYPLTQIKGQFTLVKSIDTTGGNGTPQTTRYKYTGLRQHMTGGGFLGFERASASREYSNPQPEGNQSVSETVETVYSTDWLNHHAGMPLSTVKKINGVVVSESTNIYKTNILNTTHSITTTRTTSWGNFSGGYRYFVYPSVVTNKTYELGSGTLITEEKIENTYARYGNLSFSRHTVSSGGASYTTETTNNYTTENVTNWYLGKLSNSTVRKFGIDRNGAAVAAVSKVSSWTYDPTTGAVTVERTHNGGSTLATPLVEIRHQTETSYNGVTYKDFGIRNVVNSDSLATTGSEATDRVVRTFYDDKGRFPVLTVDALGFESRSTYDYVKGVKKSETDINGLITQWEYDNFGRQIKQIAPNGVVTSTFYSECYSGCPAGAIYYVETRESEESVVTPLAGVSRAYFDKFGRNFYSTSFNKDGQEVAVFTEYDSEGRVSSTTEPYFVSQGQASLKTKTFYDASGRVVKVSNPDLSEVKFDYDGLKTTVTNELGQIKTEEEEPNSALWKTTDNNGNYITYTYDAHGNNTQAVTHTNDSATDYIVSMAYDNYGRKTRMVDPSKGTWNYVYNNRGQLVLQTDANSRRICNVYDVAGRLVARIDGYTSTSVTNARNNCYGGVPTARWVYDTAPRDGGGFWKGKLHKVFDDSIGYEKTYSYMGELGLLKAEDEKIDGYVYSTSNTYDARGRLNTTTYPSRYQDIAGKKRLTLKSVYNSYGTLDKIQDISLQGNAASPFNLWEAGRVNARGQMESEKMSGGFFTANRAYDAEDASLTDISYSTTFHGEVHHEHYNFDAIGNIEDRSVTAIDLNNSHSQIINWREEFKYDALNRLNRITFTDNRSSSTTITTPDYFENGNVKSLDTSASNQKTYTYDVVNTCANQTAKPHAVSRIMQGGSLVKSYCYDAVGNMLSSSDGRAITWNAANYPTRLAKGTNYVDIVYGPDRGRLKRTDKAGNDITVTTYVGGGYEYIKKPDASIEEKFYVAGLGMLTVKNGETDAPGTTYRYFFKDHLGSVVGVINSAFTGAGLEIDRMAYDPWGKRRKYMDVSFAVVPMSEAELLGLSSRTSTLKTTRGFTGHEMLDTIGLIHMNGRVYDPDIGRFVSADPVVQDATDVQSFNRYAYVRNNPVSLTDPSGFSWVSKHWKKFRKHMEAFYTAPLKWEKSVFKWVGREVNRNPVLGTIARVVACVGPWAPVACPIVNGALSAAQTYDATGGDWHLALKSGAVSAAAAYASAGIASGGGTALYQAVATAAVQGAASRAMGGSFADGFKASLISSAVSGAYSRSPLASNSTQGQIIGGAVVGGTTSSLTGDKFANGAMTGAFQAIATMAISEKGGAAAGEAKTDATCGPIEFATGRKWLEITDTHVGRLELKRYYNSFAHGESVMGGVWRHEFERHLDIKSYEITFIKADGRLSTFKPEGDQWISQTNRDITLTAQDDGSWLLTTADNTQEYYDATGHLQRIVMLGGYTQTLIYNDQGQLVSVTDSDNRALSFKYRADGKLYSVITSAGAETVYRYNESGMLAGAIQPDATPATLSDNARLAYLYEDGRFPQALTGYIDEAGVHYGTWQYDEQMRGSYEHTEGLNANTLVYNDDGSTTVTNALGRATTYRFNEEGKPTDVEGHATASCVGSNNAYEYDANGFISAKTDWNGVRTEYVHDARGRELRRTEAVGRPEQYTVETSWHDVWKLPVRIAAPGVTTEYTYDDTGLLLEKREIDTSQPQPKGIWAKLTQKAPARVWHYTYNEQGLLATVDGPRTDVNDITRYAYDEQGNQTVIENALGHRLQVLVHNTAGLPETLRDPNGTQTELEYNAHGWLTAKTVTTTSGDAARTEYAYSPIVQYDGTGLLQQVTSPTGAVLTYGYNADRKLSSVTNAQGERIDYRLDSMGNVTAQTVYSAQGEIVRQHAQAFDELSRLIGEISAEGHRTTHHYDKNGNRTESIDALGRATRLAYDGLNRVSSVTDALGGITRTDYTSRGDVAQVVDARGITTRYERNGFGEVTKQISQDTGTTTFAYDQAGNLIARTDARGVVAQYRYDALNRLLAVHYPADSALDVTYHYDNSAANAVGRLDRVSDQTGQRSQVFDGRGNVVSETQVIAQARYGLEYGYNAADQLISERYPSGHVLNVQRNAEGQVIDMTLSKDGVKRTILGEVDYQAFGGIEALRWGNGLEEQRAWTQDGRLAAQSIAQLTHKDYTYDAVGNLVSIADRLQAANDRVYGYDALDRLTTSRTGTEGVELFAYDAVGNRTAYERAERGETVIAEAYRYESQSNRLLEVSRGEQSRVLGYDAVGNTVRDQGYDGKAQVLDYGVDNRLKSVDDGVTYWHNAEGQRVIARVDKGLKHFIYDVQDRLVAEANADGAVVREYFYLDRVPVAMLDVANDELYFVQGDHLGTPKLVTDAAGDVVWSGEALAFGGTKVSGSVALDFRFPGQVEDSSTGYFYNYYRDYDATVGRYLQSDPIGLMGGMNTYGYVDGSPIINLDIRGLVLEQIWDGQGRGNFGTRSANIDKAITAAQFVEFASGKSLSQLQGAKYSMFGSWRSGGGPGDNYRYVLDPAGGNQVVDMRHFLSIGPQGEFIGLVGEIIQSAVGDESAFQSQDFFSNNLGTEFFENYSPAQPVDGQLKSFFEKRCPAGQCCL